MYLNCRGLESAEESDAERPESFEYEGGLEPLQRESEDALASSGLFGAVGAR